MTPIFEFTNYRKFILERFKLMPKKGYGQSRKLAQFLGVHTTLVSQIFQGLKSMTLEQAASTADYLALNELETEYFLLLVQLDRAGNEPLRRTLKRQVENLRVKSVDLVNRMKPARKLKEEEQAIFYSDWVYSAVRQMTAIDGFQNLEKISSHLGLSLRRTRDVMDFLVRTGLCKEEKNTYSVGTQSTHLAATSPLVRSHHINWRHKGIEQINQDFESKLFFTSPMTVSKKDILKIREVIIYFLDQVDKVVEPSPSEELMCLNVDWFKVR